MEQQFISAAWPDWEVVRKIGEGSFGGVYEIRRTLPDGSIEKSALKKISIPRNSSEIREMYDQYYPKESITIYYKNQMSELVREYSLTRELNECRNVVSCQDIRCVQHGDGIGWDVYIRMELLRPLKTALGSTYREKTVLRLGLSMCNALVACQEKNIIHRDIKPENILVSEKGEFKLGDFGIAKVSEKTASGTMTGTVGYMAPEVANRQHYGFSADIYSLGMVLYWAMNERTLPFLPLPPTIPTAIQRQEATNRRLSGEMIPAPMHGSAELKRIVWKATAFDPHDRYTSVQEMGRDLQRCYRALKERSATESQENSGYSVLREIGLSENSLNPYQQYDTSMSTGRTATVGMNRSYTQPMPRKKRMPQLLWIPAIIVLIVGIMLIWNPFGGKERSEGVSVAATMPTNPVEAPMDTIAAVNPDDAAIATTAAAPSASSGATEVSDDWKDFTFSMEGVVYQLPTHYQNFVAHGWKIDGTRSNISEDDMLPANSHTYFYMTNNAVYFSAEVINMSGNARMMKDCDVGAVTITASDNLDLKLAGGIGCLSTIEEIQSAYGVPSSVSTYTDNSYLEYEVNYYIDMKFNIYNSQTTYNSITLRNFVATDRDQTTAKDERPAYLDTYVAPAELGDDIKSTRFILDGVVYQLPCPLDAFTANGWTVQSDSIGTLGAGNDEYGVTLAKGNYKINLSMINLTDFETYTKNCAVSGVSIYTYDLKNAPRDIVQLPGGITLWSTLEDIQETYKDFDCYDGTSSSSFTYYNRDYSAKIYYHYYKEDKDGSIEIKNENWNYQ